MAHHYSKAKYFSSYSATFEELFLGSSEERYLSRVNFRFIEAICRMLSIDTEISWSSDYSQADGKTERLLHLCEQVEATRYLSGPSAKDYMDESLFEEAGIEISWMDYSDYPEYDQLYPPFDHQVSIIDLIFNTGPDTPAYMKCMESVLA